MIDVAVSRTPDDTVIRVKGEAGVGTAGALLDDLLAPAACRSAVVTLDLSELRCISSLAMGVLVAYCREDGAPDGPGTPPVSAAVSNRTSSSARASASFTAGCNPSARRTRPPARTTPRR